MNRKKAQQVQEQESQVVDMGRNIQIKLCEMLGIDVDEFMNMDADEQEKLIEKHIEERSGKKMGYDCDFRIDGVKVKGSKTIEEVDAKMDRIIAEERKNREKFYASQKRVPVSRDGILRARHNNSREK